jgi:hypothetical protein
MYVVVSLEYLEKFILPIDEKSGRYSLVSEQFALWTIRINLIEFRNQQGERSNRDVHLRTFVHTIFVLSMVAKVVLQQSPGSLILKNY